jgi:chemotaxis protein CheX
MLDLNFINPFILGTVDAMKVQGGLTVQPGKPFLKGKEPMPAIMIAAQLGLTSSKFKGALSLCFEEKFFLKMVSNMLRETVSEINTDNQDAASEILNMVYGSAKTALNPRGFTFERAIPTVVRGKDLQTSHGRLPTLVIPLNSEFGSMFIELTVHEAN